LFTDLILFTALKGIAPQNEQNKKDVFFVKENQNNNFFWNKQSATVLAGGGNDKKVFCSFDVFRSSVPMTTKTEAEKSKK